MTQTAPPTTDNAQTQQFMLFDLGETIAPPAPAELPLQREATPPATARSSKRSQRPAVKTSTHPTPVDPVRLEITPAPELPELPSLQLAAVRAALCQALAAQAQAAYQALLAGRPDDQKQPKMEITPERIATAAQLLSESPALNAAVSLLALEAPE
jgi:hypothetical protein